MAKKSTCIWACGQLKICNLSPDNVKKTRNVNGSDTWVSDMVKWYWSVDTLFWQLSIDLNMDVQYQDEGSHTT